MAVDRHHAFAEGPTFEIAAVGRSGWLRLLSAWLARCLSRRLLHEQSSEAARVFLRNAVVGTRCRIGPRAWCCNGGPRENVLLGKAVICRGILRSEGFHPGQIVLGDHVYIGDDCLISCAESVEIGSLTMLAHGVQIFDNDSHPLDPNLREQDYGIILGECEDPRPFVARAPVLIGERCWIGSNAIILKGVRIGACSVIGAGSVVASDIPPWSIAVGNPARVVRHITVTEKTIGSTC